MFVKFLKKCCLSNIIETARVLFWFCETDVKTDEKSIQGSENPTMVSLFCNFLLQMGLWKFMISEI